MINNWINEFILCEQKMTPAWIFLVSKMCYKSCNKQAHLFWLILLFHLYKNITCIPPLMTLYDLAWLIHISLIFRCLRGPAMELWNRSHALHLRDPAKFVVFFPFYVVDTHLTVTWLPYRSHWAFWLRILSLLLRLRSLVTSRSSFHHSPVQRAKVMMGPKLSH